MEDGRGGGRSLVEKGGIGQGGDREVIRLVSTRQGEKLDRNEEGGAR